MSNQRRMSDTNVFNRLLQGNRRSAMTPGPNPQPSTTPTPSSRNQRWQSDAENVNHFSDFDAKNIAGVGNEQN